MSTFTYQGYWFYGLTRRSIRLANKNKSTVSDPISDRVDVILAIADHCKKKGLEYSDTLLDEWDTWCKAGDSKNWPQDCSHSRVASLWAKYYSKSLCDQEYMIKCHETFQHYCAKKNIKYTPEIYANFLVWHQNPANTSLVTQTSSLKTEGGVHVEIWRLPPATVIRRFFKAQPAEN